MIVRTSSLHWSLLVPALLALTACGGSSAEIGSYGASPDAGPPDAPDASGTGTGTGGPSVAVHLVATTAPVKHDDALSGQTPKDQRLGIRKLTLFKSPSDPTPLVVFDHGADAIEAGLNDGDDTAVGTAPASALVPGTYVLARVTVSHVRYVVAATMHAQVPIAGEFHNVEVLSDGSNLDGELRSKGHYVFSFVAGGATLGTHTGENAPVPQSPSGGGITLDSTGSESAYVFPVNLTIPEEVPTDARVDLGLNTHENFRWKDQDAPGYADDVFDVTPTTYEPVMSFGANAFTLTLR